jgi:WD40 repeat protein
MNEGNHIAVGCADSAIQIWDVKAQKKVRTLRGHSQRVGALAWNSDKLLSSGGRDGLIFNHDLRAPNHRVSCYESHEEEICGLAWSPDGNNLASGGNDNKCVVWDKIANRARWELGHHTAGVKALAWCPWQRSLLATGGGSADRHIRFFNTSTKTLLHDIDSKSQVCSLVWSEHSKEIMSAHGFSQNQLTVWKYPTLQPIANLVGHTSRVLHTGTLPFLVLLP